MANAKSEPAETNHADLIIVGGGAAGLATAIFTARRRPGRSILVLDSARKLGAKILVSGGGRCNATNVAVSPDDFWGGSRNVVRRILRAFTEKQTVEFFREIGVGLHEEENGKLFPDSNSAKTVLDALLGECQQLGIRILTGRRVLAVAREAGGYAVRALTSSDATAEFQAPCLVLATGGRSLPKTGSDGTGYALAADLGHSLVPTTPGLAPLILEGDFHVALSGISQVVEITIRIEYEKPLRLRGSMLWTHFGVSGPVILDASRHWHRAKLEQRTVALGINFLPDDTFETADRMLIATAEQQGRTQLHNALGALCPDRFLRALLRHLKIDASTPMNVVSRETRRRLVHALLDFPLPIRDSRGYGFAEVTAGGVALEEIDPATMESRKSPGLFLVGEILDVDGRIGGFNFQWAWSSGWVAGKAVASREG